MAGLATIAGPTLGGLLARGLPYRDSAAADHGGDARSRRSCATAAEVFSNGYVLAMRWTMLMPIAAVVLAAASCFAIKNKPGQDRPAAGEQAGQMAETISSPGSSGSLGNNPGSSSGTAS